jgi:hypothetical protein
MQRLATQTLAHPPPFATMRLRAEARAPAEHARAPGSSLRDPQRCVVLLVGLFWWYGAPPQNVVRESIDLATSASRLLTGGLGLSIFLAFAMLAFVLMEEGRAR